MCVKLIVESLSSHNFFDIQQFAEFLELLIDFLVAVHYISEDIYKLLQSFFNYYNSLPDSGLNKFWTKDIPSTQVESFRTHITTIQRKLLDKLTKYLTIATDEAIRTNTILVKLCIMIHVNPVYESAMHFIYNGLQLEKDNQKEIMKILIQVLHNRATRFELYDRHFIQTLHDFIYYRKNIAEGGQDILKILMYVFTICSSIVLSIFKSVGFFFHLDPTKLYD